MGFAAATWNLLSYLKPDNCEGNEVHDRYINANSLNSIYLSPRELHT